MSHTMTPAQKQLWNRSLMASAGIVITGILLYKFVTPTKEQLLSRMSPELRAEHEKNKELRMKEQEILMEIVKKTAASNDPIWKTGPIMSPWDKNNVQSSESILVKKEKFERGLAADEQKRKLKELQKQMELTDSLEQEQKKEKKSWYKLW